MRAAQAMSRDVIAIPAELDLAAAWRLMQRESIRHLPVVKNGVLIGILSDRDLLSHGETRHGGLHFDKKLLALHAMTPAPLVCTRDARVHVLVREMIERKIDAIPVIDPGDRLVGMVTSTDLLSLLLHYEDVTIPYRYRICTAEEGPPEP